MDEDDIQNKRIDDVQKNKDLVKLFSELAADPDAWKMIKALHSRSMKELIVMPALKNVNPHGDLVYTPTLREAEYVRLQNFAFRRFGKYFLTHGRSSTQGLTFRKVLMALLDEVEK